MIRIDIALVQKKIFETRNKAQFAIKNNLVYCNGMLIKKNNYLVSEEDVLEVKGDLLPYVSKGGLKLEKALKKFNIKLKGKNMIDIGSSTGGFSDCALQNGISKIYAVDVGSNQFNRKLLESNKIILKEKTDFRKLNNEDLLEYDIAVIDVSFISILKLLPKIEQLNNLNEIILLIKPQFECGMEIARKYNGIIINKEIHHKIINQIISEFHKINYFLTNFTYSPICGGSGNIEYLAYFVKNTNNSIKVEIEKEINLAFKKLKNI